MRYGASRTRCACVHGLGGKAFDARRFIRIKSLYGLPPSFSFYGKGNMQKSDLPSQSFLMAKLETRNKIQSDGNEWRTMRRVKRFQHSRFSWCIIARRLLEWGGKIY